MRVEQLTQKVEALINILMVLDEKYEAFQKQLKQASVMAQEVSPEEKLLIQQAFLPLMSDPLQEPDPYRRASIGRVIGLLNLDKRKGIGLTDDNLPDIDWIEIPAGEFIYQQDETLDLPRFYISRYHVTYQQFQVFLDAEDGFTDSRWWEGLAERKERYQAQNEKPEQVFPFGNHPVDGVSWYDAIAFCRWWSYRLGGTYDIDSVMDWKVRLPTEQEWEKAGRGRDGRIFPWGNDFVSGYSNMDETDRFNVQEELMKIESGNIGKYYYGAPTAPGIFPQSASPYAVMDMVGTMWDITLTEYRYGKNDDLVDYYPRVIRGGTWFTSRVYNDLVRRTMFSPHIRTNGDLRKNDYSFRVATTQRL